MSRKRKPLAHAPISAEPVRNHVMLSRLMHETVRLARASYDVILNPRRKRGPKGSGDYHNDTRTIDDLRTLSRQMERNSSTYSGLLNSWQTYLVGSGPEYVGQTADPEWNSQAATLIAEDLEAKAHDVQLQYTWPAWVKVMALSVARDGQMGVIYSPEGSMLIEAERVLDISTDSANRHLSYSIGNYNKSGTQVQPTSVTHVDAAVMDLLAFRTRTSQQWGMPVCFASFEDHGGISELWSSEIEASAESVKPWLVIQQLKAATAAVGQLLGNPNTPRNNDESINGRPAPTTTPSGWVETDKGCIIGMPKDYEAHPFKPDRPNTDVAEFSTAMLRVCCMKLLPYELAFHDPSGLSFSNARSVRKIAEMMLNSFRADYLNLPCTRTIRVMLAKHIQAGRLAARDDWYQMTLKWPEIAEHDRGKERQADSIDLTNGTTSLKRLKGEDWRAILDERANEYSYAAQLVAQHNQSYPESQISLSHIIGDPSRMASVTATMQDTESGNTNET